MNTKETQGDSKKKQLKEGIGFVYNAVSKTFGPNGSLVLIKTLFQELIATKDGVTVARNIKGTGFKGMGIDLIKAPAIALNEEVGDGTTSSVILTKHLIDTMAIHNKKETGINFNHIKEILSKHTIPFSSEVVEKVALISSNGNKEIANTLKEIYEEYDNKVHIFVETGYTETYVEKEKGWYMPNGFISPYSVNDYRRFAVVLNGPIDVFIFNDKWSDRNLAYKVATSAMQSTGKLLLVVDDVTPEIMHFFAQLFKEGKLYSVFAKTPSFGYGNKDVTRDLATVTGAPVFTNTKKEARHLFGKATRLYVDSVKTVVGVEQKSHDSLLTELQDKLKLAQGVHQKRKIEERIKNVQGGVAVIYVGGETDKDRKEKEYAYEDAVSAVKSAEKGVIKGGLFGYYIVAKETSNKLLREAFKGMFKDLYGYEIEDFSRFYYLYKKHYDFDSKMWREGDYASVGVLEPVVLVEKVLRTADRIATIYAKTDYQLYNEKQENDISFEN